VKYHSVPSQQQDFSPVDTRKGQPVKHIKTTLPKVFNYLSIILPGKLTENTFSFAATTWGIVTWERKGMNE
jgi:hypothetical protein